VSPRPGTAEQFTVLRSFLLDAGYDEDSVRARMGIAALSESLKMQATGPPDDVLEALIHLFLLGVTLDAARLLPAGILNLLQELGLLQAAGGGFIATVELYPVRHLHIVSDRNRGDELPPGEDKVFSAITPQTEEFLAMLPETPCPSLLELCSGAGAAALLAASRYAVQAFAYDLSPRSARFAEFNRKLNGIENATVRQGDLYAPAGRRTFDRIVAHPPYVPALHATELLRDGGEIGEDLTHRIIAGLPTFLHPGGRLYCLALLAQTQDEPLEQRVRGWLREAERDFDVVIVALRRMDPARVVFDNWRERHAQPGDIARWQYLIKHRRIQAFVHAAILVQKRTDEREVVTLARESGGPYPREAVEALLVPEADIWSARVEASPGIRMTKVSELAGGWSAETLRFSAEAPFRFSWEGPRWVAGFLAACDGRCTGRGLLPPGVAPADFERAVRQLASGGLLRLRM